MKAETKFIAGYLVISALLNGCGAQLVTSHKQSQETSFELASTLVPATKANVPQLSSNPQARVKFYLDFSGDAGGGSIYGFAVAATPAFDLDSDPSTFNSTELSAINQIWVRIAEKFSPFDVDVTTIDPGVYPDAVAMKVVIGGDGQWFDYGHYASATSQGAFYDASVPNIVYQFSAQSRGYIPIVTDTTTQAMATALGVDWQSSYDQNGVLTAVRSIGNSQIAPIMGNSSYSQRALWWHGMSNNSNPQDDVEFITVGGTIFVGNTYHSSFGFRPDDHGNTMSSATPLAASEGVVTLSGVIEKPDDVDFFSFNTSGGQVTLQVTGAKYAQMLDPIMRVFNSSGQQIALADSSALSESATLTLESGNYYIAISGHGLIPCFDTNGLQQGSGYDLGQYTLTANLPIATPPADTTAPITSISSPANGASVSGVISVAVAASDNVGVSKVELYRDGALVGSSVAAPYSFSMDSKLLANGSHSLQSKAYDAAGNIGSSAVISINVNNVVLPPPDTTAPIISITSPANSANVSGVISVAVAASDNVGVSKVELYRDGALVGSSGAAPYIFSIDTSLLANGLHGLQSKAFDAAGNVGSSAIISINVNNVVLPPTDTTAPITSISSPSNGANVTGSISVAVAASDNVAVSKVELYVDSVLKSTLSSSPYNFSLNTDVLNLGTHSVQTKAYDAAGNIGSSVIVQINVIDNIAPITSITSPANGATVSSVVTVSASASDNRAVSKIEIYLDGIIKSSSASLSLDTTLLTNGLHSLQSKAYDAAGNIGSSSIVQINVNNIVLPPPPPADTTPPVVSIASPIGTTVARGTTVTIGVNASDNIGVTQVLIYVNGSLRCTDTVAPYSCSYPVSRKAGKIYTFKAVAFDTAGNSSSAQVQVTTK